MVGRLAVVHGRVTLSSGREADYYVDLRRATLHHEASPLIGVLLRQLTADWEFDAVGGLTLGADPVATAVMHAPGRPLNAFVVRKQAKAHGMQRQIEGPDVVGRRVLVVEDTTTTGNSPITAVEALREIGADVVGVATIVDRQTGADQVFARGGPGVPVPARVGRPRPATDVTAPETADSDGTEPSGAEPSGADPRGADPSGAEPSGAEPSGAEPSGADPSGADPSGADPSVRTRAVRTRSRVRPNGGPPGSESDPTSARGRSTTVWTRSCWPTAMPATSSTTTGTGVGRRSSPTSIVAGTRCTSRSRISRTTRTSAPSSGPRMPSRSTVSILWVGVDGTAAAPW